MSGLILSIITNVILGVLFLSLYGPRIVQSIKTKKDQRERQRVTERYRKTKTMRGTKRQIRHRDRITERHRDSETERNILK